MRTLPLVWIASRSVGLRLLSTAVLGFAVQVACADTPGDQKPYTLFMGADLAVGLKSEIYPVADVSGSSWVVKVNGNPVRVSTNDGPVNLKMTPGLKLTEISASIANLKSEPAYTPGNDPSTKFTRAMNQAANDAAQSQYAANQANALQDETTVEVQRLVGSNGTDAEKLAQQLVDVSAQASSAASAQAGAALSQNLPTGLNPSSENFDALEVSFEISARRTLDHPYVVVVARYHDPSAPPGSYKNWIYARATERIDSRPSRVRFLAGGFPPGFQVKSFEVHLYNDGNEVATNLSSKRVELTRDEAFEYVKMEYLSRHKGDTLPAAPAMGNLPSDFPTRVAQGQFNQPIYVKVSKDGIGTGAFVDESCSQKVGDPYVDSIVSMIRFKPALREGQPVEGVAKVRLGELLM